MVAYRSEMARNVIESEFRTSKMADGSIFVKNFQKLKLRMKWPEMRSNFSSDIQNERRRPFCQNLFKKIKFHIDLKWPEM